MKQESKLLNIEWYEATKLLFWVRCVGFDVGVW